MDHPGGLDSQGRCVATLAMLAADDSKVLRAGKEMALDWNKPYGDQTWAWHLGFQGIALSEYHLLTGHREAWRRRIWTHAMADMSGLDDLAVGR